MASPTITPPGLRCGVSTVTTSAASAVCTGRVTELLFWMSLAACAGIAKPRASAEARIAAVNMCASVAWRDAFDSGHYLQDHGLDGRTIRFHVEHKHGENDWTDYDKVEAKVANGVAEARLQLKHPAPGEAEASAADLRFACELV